MDEVRGRNEMPPGEEHLGEEGMTEYGVAILPELVEPIIRRAVDALVTEFAYRIDFEQGLTVPELFTSDGYYEQDGKRSTGRSAIRNAYTKRASLGPRTARHLFTNLRLTRVGHREYAGASIMLLFAENGLPPLPAAPLLVADVADRYECHGDRILIRSRTLTSIFIRAGASYVLPLGDDEEA